MRILTFLGLLVFWLLSGIAYVLQKDGLANTANVLGGISVFALVLGSIVAFIAALEEFLGN